MPQSDSSFKRGMAPPADLEPREEEATSAPRAGLGDRKPLILAPIRRETLRPRTLAAVAAALCVVALARPSAASVAVGLPLIVLGEAIRLWAAGHLYKTRELVTSGPYGYVRHPLYLGTLLVGAGLMTMAGLRVALVGIPLGLVFFFGYYLPYKEEIESRRLEAAYGDRFRAYRAAIPMLWVRRRPERGPWADEARPWRFERVRDNGEVATALTIAIAALAILAVGALDAML